MSNGTVNAQLMKIADEAFWDEFYQIDRAGDRYIVVDSKNQKIVGENLRLVKEKKKVRV